MLYKIELTYFFLDIRVFFTQPKDKIEKIDLWKDISDAIADWFTSDSINFVKGIFKNTESNTGLQL